MSGRTIPWSGGNTTPFAERIQKIRLFPNRALKNLASVNNDISKGVYLELAIHCQRSDEANMDKHIGCNNTTTKDWIY